MPLCAFVNTGVLACYKAGIQAIPSLFPWTILLPDADRYHYLITAIRQWIHVCKSSDARECCQFLGPCHRTWSKGRVWSTDTSTAQEASAIGGWWPGVVQPFNQPYLETTDGQTYTAWIPNIVWESREFGMAFGIWFFYPFRDGTMRYYETK